MKLSISSQLADHITKDILLSEAAPARFVRALIFLVSATLIGFFVWASFSQLSITSVGQGFVLPASPVQEIQHSEGGRIEEIHVVEGQSVKAGDLLVTLDDLDQQSDYRAAQVRYWSLLARVESLRAFLSGHDMKKEGIPVQFNEYVTVHEQNLQSLRKEVAQLEGQIQLLSEIASIRGELAEQKLGTKTQALEARSNLAQLKNELLRTKRTSLRDLQQSRVELSDALESLNKVKAKYKRVQLFANSDGVIQEIKHKTAQTVVAPGAVIMTLLPSGDPSQAEIHIAPNEIGFIQEGQAVKIKLATYDYVRYGSISGQVHKVLPGNFTDAKGVVYHKVIVGFADAHLKNQPHKKVLPGMQIQADVITDRQTVMRYLLRPIYVAFDQGMRER